MNYSDWLKRVPETLMQDSLWRMEAYRLDLFSSDFAWQDVSKLMRDRRTLGLASLYEAMGSIGANLAEGYSRGSSKDRARFYEYALGSARESRTWYFDARHVLGEEVVQHRMGFLSQIIRLLLTMIPDQRGSSLHEEPARYGTATPDFSDPAVDIPMPGNSEK